MHGHVGGLAYGLFDERTDPGVGIYGGQLLSQGRYSAGDDFPGGWSWLIANAVKPNSLIGAAHSRPGIAGPDLEPFLRRASRGLAAMTLLGHGTSVESNRVTLLDETDDVGMPRARVVHDFDDDALARFEAAAEEGRQTMRAAGAREAWTGDLTVIRMMGGTIMGDEPRAR